jgi:hypothetical protein
MESKDLEPDFWYSSKELAFRWNMSDDTVRRRFRHVPGVMAMTSGRPGKGGRKPYTTLRIQGRTAMLVKSSWTIAETR